MEAIRIDSRPGTREACHRADCSQQSSNAIVGLVFSQPQSSPLFASLCTERICTATDNSVRLADGRWLMCRPDHCLPLLMHGGFPRRVQIMHVMSLESQQGLSEGWMMMERSPSLLVWELGAAWLDRSCMHSVFFESLRNDSNFSLENP